MFEFGGHANLAGLSLLDIRASLDSPIYFPEWPTIEICCIFVPKSVQICLQSSKIRPPNSNVDKCVGNSLFLLCYRAILGQLENVVKNIYPEGAMFAGMLGHMPFLLKDD